ncbi:MAG: DNA polymerase III subunit beta [Clostridia bacterium]|nr:DNA polymerase III subunit beta [Clostridia bacterium]
MKVFCQGLDLSEAILKVIKAASSKTTNPILEGIKLTAEDNTLILVATDGELAIEKRIVADVKIEGETVIPGKFFSEYVRKLTGEQIELTLNEKNQLKIKYTDSEVFIQCLNVLEFPNVQKIESEEYFEIEQAELKDLIQKTIFSVSLEDTRPVLKGCLFEVGENKVTSVALDGYRLALAVKPIKKSTAKVSLIIPGRSLNEMSKLLDDSNETIRVYMQKNYLMVEQNSTKIITRLLDGDFINYKQIIPTNFTSVVTVNRLQLEDALDRASILARVSSDNSVKFNIKDNVLNLQARSEIGNVDENLTIALSGEDLTISFDARFFKECLRVTEDDFLKLCFTTSINPCVVRPNEGEDYLFLILPLKQLY